MTVISSRYYTTSTEVLFPNHNKRQQNSKPNPLVSFPLKNVTSNSSAEVSVQFQESSIRSGDSAAAYFETLNFVLQSRERCQILSTPSIYAAVLFSLQCKELSCLQRCSGCSAG